VEENSVRSVSPAIPKRKTRFEQRQALLRAVISQQTALPVRGIPLSGSAEEDSLMPGPAVSSFTAALDQERFFGELYPRLVAAARGQGLSDADAQDIAQDACVRLQLQPEEKRFNPNYALAIVHNLAIDRYRAHRCGREVYPDGSRQEQSGESLFGQSAAPTPLDVLLERERAASQAIRDQEAENHAERILARLMERSGKELARALDGACRNYGRAAATDRLRFISNFVNKEGELRGPRRRQLVEYLLHRTGMTRNALDANNSRLRRSLRALIAGPRKAA
jgi:DNA-directed RNA polymerase specialized sigma24 family protein